VLEESAEDLYEHAPCGYLSTRPDGSIVRVNETFLQWTGYDRAGLIGRRFAELLTPGGRIYLETHFEPLLRMQGAVREIALELVCADGRRLPALVNSTLRTDGDGRPQGIRTTIFNATDRKAYERELQRAHALERAARQRTERLQDVTAALAAVLDPEQIAEAVVAAVAAGGADEVVLAALGPGEPRLEVLASQGSSRATLEAWSQDGLRRELPVAAALESGELALLEHPPDGVPLAQPSALLAIVPLVFADGPTGMLAAAFREPPKMEQADRELLVAIARQAAQALERARLHAATRAGADRARLLADAAHAVQVGTTLATRAQILVDVVVPRLAVAARVEVDGDDGPRTVAEAAADDGARAGLDRSGAAAFALRARGRRVGTLVLSGAIDELVVSELADRAALALENARLWEREQNIAHAMQQSLLAGEPPVDPRYEVATRYEPGIEALQVGGDWHDAFVAGEDRLMLVVGDVVGRGLEAASAMGQLRSAVRAFAAETGDPAAALDHLERFVSQFDVGRSATVALVELDLRDGTLRYACAGHPPPVLVEPGVAPRLLWDGRSPPLDAFRPPAPRPCGTATIAPGGRLVLYSDGLVERRGRALDDGFDELLAELAARTASPPAALVDELFDALVAADGANDDVCVLCLALTPGG